MRTCGILAVAMQIFGFIGTGKSVLMSSKVVRVEEKSFVQVWLLDARCFVGH